MDAMDDSQEGNPFKQYETLTIFPVLVEKDWWLRQDQNLKELKVLISN